MWSRWAGRFRKRTPLAIGALILAPAIFAGCSTGGTGAPRPTVIVGTPTQAQMLTSLAQAAAGTVPVTVAFSTATSTSLITVTATFTGEVARTPDQIQASQERVKAVTFVLQRALWAEGGAQPGEVKVNVLGPLLDDYFDRVTDWYGISDLTAATEAKFDWSALTADSAWPAYDTDLLRASYAPFQDWGAPTATPTQP